MKKRLFIGIMISSIILTGCGDKEEKVDLKEDISDTIQIENSDEAKLICTKDAVYDDYNYSVGAKYVVFTDDEDMVTKIVSREIIALGTDDKDALEQYKAAFEDDHKIPSQYDGYEGKVTTEGRQIISDTTIDYTKFDLKKFVEDNDLDASFDPDDELKLDNIEARYVSLGSVCEKK